MRDLSEIKRLRLSVDNHTLFRILTFIIVYVGIIAFVWTTRQIWVLLLVAFFLTLALNPPVSYLAKRLFKGKRGLATGIAYLIVLSLISGLLYATIPPLVEQSQQLADRLPSYVNELETSDTTLARLARRTGMVEELKDSEARISSKVGGPIFDFFKRFTSSLLSVLVVLGLTFFMLVEGPRWLSRFWSLHPRDREKHRKQLAYRMYKVVTGYVNGQLFVAFLAGTAAFIILTILSVPYSLPLAAAVSVLGLIPLVGATLGAVIAVIVGLFQSVAIGLILLIFFVIYQQFENYVIYPMVQSKALEISPLLILVAALFGANLAGLLGALLAIPTAACLRILMLDYIERHRLAHKES